MGAKIAKKAKVAKKEAKNTFYDRARHIVQFTLDEYAEMVVDGADCEAERQRLAHFAARDVVEALYKAFRA